jgi:hypothetical protein
VSDDAPQLAWERGAQERARRADRKRRRRRYALIVVVALVAIALVAGASWVWLLRDDELIARAKGFQPEVTFDPSSRFSSESACRWPLTPDDPLRIWIGGDSLAGSLGPALGSLTADTGVAQPTYDYRTSSGLASPSFFDWPEEAALEMSRVDPEVVVFIIGANDSGFVTSTPLADDGQPAWRAAYAQLVTAMLDALGADGRAVYWVGSPTLRDEDKNADVAEINDVAREVVGQRARATYVDAYDLFADESGEYTATLPGFDGDTVRVRTPDGIHFSEAGGELLAEYVFAFLNDRCALIEQAVEGARQPVRVSPGSGEVPGPSTSTSGTTMPTTSTTTQPPTTTSTPPTTILSLPVPVQIGPIAG